MTQDRFAIDRRSALLLAAACALPLRPALAAPVAKLGAREVHVLSDGAFSMAAASSIRDRSPDEVIALLKANGVNPEGMQNVLNVTAIKDAEGWTLIDCGSGDKFLPGSGKLLDSLDAAGIDRKQVKRILMTHCHPDHLWGAVDSFDEIAFPEATIHISEVEHDFWRSPDAVKAMSAGREMFASGAARVLKSVDEKIKRFKPGQEVAPGIVAVDTAGHAPGHVSFVVSAGGQSLMVLGDALTQSVISFTRPDWHLVNDQDPGKGAATRRRLLDQLAKDRLPFIGYHLPVPGLGRAEAKDGAYRFLAG